MASSDFSAGGRPGFSSTELKTLEAAFDTVIPTEVDGPGGWSGGVSRLLEEHGADFMGWAIGPLGHAAATLDAAATRAGAARFSALTLERRLVVFDEAWAAENLSADGSAVDDTVGPLSVLVRVAMEGFYGGTREPAGWSIVGFQPLPDGVVPVEPVAPEGISVSQLQSGYDVIVVGGGAGGGVAAAELSARGLHVLLIERSRPMQGDELRNNHLQGKRAQLYDPIAGPGAGHPRVVELADGSTQQLDGQGSGDAWGLTAMTLGGGTRVWQGMSWRFLPQDFAMATTYGSPADSTLVDWPFDYDEIAPYYDRVEWELGVSGAGSAPISRRTQRSRDYPMPPLPSDGTRAAFTEAAHRLGWSASPIPFAINSVPRAGRAACVQCSQCLGNACPVDAKNGSHNTFIPRALATGACDLLMKAQVVRLTHDGTGKATGVSLMIDTPAGPVLRHVMGERIVLAAGAVETPRLLLASGLGNTWVGRNSHNHGIATALAGSAPWTKTWAGPGHSVATFDFVHTDPAAWGGGVLFDSPAAYPVTQARFGQLFSAPYGAEHKRWMREHPVLVGAMSMVQEIPHAASRISIDPNVADRWGMPVARMKGVPHEATVRATNYMVQRCVEWVREVGGRDLIEFVSPGGFHATEHCAGTARFGTDPEMSACDPTGRLHGTVNVYVADASLHPTNGSVNPALTVMANSMRVADLMARDSR